MTLPREKRGLVRPYVVTEGRSQPSRNTFDLLTLVIATPLDKTGLNPEKRRLLALCEEGMLSVAEVSAWLGLPVSVVKVLLADLSETGHIRCRPSVPPAMIPKAQVLQEVLDGLRARI
ncbi:DUF742 domain-containing protein [Streptomyces sp. WAC 01325]|uniref:DUF742 domain-containing protein n=1 Tax=Streptomyces sp. WAC 01325 TaxID=2203202 RepID=UPI000F887E7E|nr:DUF742 domain-containing protein [Streptomyces sp. WAC 01325]RSM93720.1 DUF742 domain-containing protein [Streptomyces sp. WAC 01325]